jgi:hypothetical protein
MRLVTGFGAGRNPHGSAGGGAVVRRGSTATGAQIPGAARPDRVPRGGGSPHASDPGSGPRPVPPRGARAGRLAGGGRRPAPERRGNPAPNLNQAAVDATRVPILLPADAKLTAGARIYSFGDYYTITADAPGAGVSLSGTTAVVPLPADAPLKITPMGPEGATSQRTVDGQLDQLRPLRRALHRRGALRRADRPALRRRQLRARPGRQDHRRGDGRRRPRRRRPGGLRRCASC